MASIDNSPNQATGPQGPWTGVGGQADENLLISNGQLSTKRGDNCIDIMEATLV
jgi:hypothetical protein